MRVRVKNSVVSIILMLLMIVTMPTVSSAENITADGLKYTIENNEVIIKDYLNEAAELTIPNTINGYPVTVIGRSAFSDCETLKKITLPECIEIIEDSAFRDCKNLETINIPEGVTEVGAYAFQSCGSLRNVNIPNSLEKISVHMFGMCTSLEKIMIPDSITEIGEWAFSFCSSLKNIVIPDSVIKIDGFAFTHCTGLTSVTIPSSVTSIDFFTFNDCTSLKSIVADKNNPNYTSIDGVLFDKNITSIVCFPGGKTGNYTAPSTLLSALFDHCSLSSVVVLNPHADIRFTYCDYLEEVILPEGMTKLPYHAFFMCPKLTSVNIPSTVTSIEASAFEATGIVEIDIPSSVKSVGQYAFSSTKIKNIAFPDSVETIGDGVIMASRIKTVTLPKNLKSIGKEFLKNTSVETVYYPGTVEDWAKVQVGEDNQELLNALQFKDGLSKPSVSSCTIKLEETKYTYDGKAKTPKVTVLHGSKKLSENIDYTVAYFDNTAVGTAKVVIKGIGIYTGSVTKLFTIENSQAFTWGKDNWNFINSSPRYFPDSTYRNQIGNKYLTELKKNLTNSEYQFVFIGSLFSEPLLDTHWGGSCYGMSSTALLSKLGYLNCSDYQSGATSVYQLNYPVQNSELNSLITYYQMLQVKDVIQQQYRTVPNQSHKDNISALIAQLDENPTVLVGFKKNGWGGHAILAYDYEYGSYTFNGVTYQGCIKICDPNASVAYDKDFNIYFNTKSYNWVIPAYNGIASSSGAVFNYIGADVDDINKGGYLKGTKDSNLVNYVARIDAYAISDNRSVSKMVGSNGVYMNQSSTPGDIVEDYSYISGSTLQGTVGYNLYDSNAAYAVYQSNPEKLQLTMDYDNCDITVSSAAGLGALFDKAGYVEVESESASYVISMTHDYDYPTDWFTVSVSGNSVDKASMQMIGDGYVVKADNLEDTTVSVNNKETYIKATFTTECTSAFIYEIDEKTIGVKVDKDNNGTFETDLYVNNEDVSVLPECKCILGDANGDGVVNIKDATEIQKAIAGLTSLESDGEILADVDGSGEVNIKDATAIQKHIAGMETGYPIGIPKTK